MEEFISGERMPEVVVREVVYVVVERVEKIMVVGVSIVEGGEVRSCQNGISESNERLG